MPFAKPTLERLSLRYVATGPPERMGISEATFYNWKKGCDLIVDFESQLHGNYYRFLPLLPQPGSCPTKGVSPNGHQRYKCEACKRSFQLDYAKKAYQPGIKEQVIDMASNGSGIRDTARVLKINMNTVMSTLKKSGPNRFRKPGLLRAESTLRIRLEADEQCRAAGAGLS